MINERTSDDKNFYNVLLELCLDNNFEEYTPSEKTILSQKNRFDILINSGKININYITYIRYFYWINM